jgi:hypothetical protein
VADREPIRSASRPNGEMPSDRPPLASPHSSHDLVVLAAAADRDADPAMRAAAADQVAACDECAALAGELRAIAAGLAALPEARPVPRDMRITADQAARLRRGGLWRRLLRPFGPDGLATLRPIAATLTTLGLAGLLLTALPLDFGLGGAAVLHTIGSPVSPAGGTTAEQPVPEVAAASPASSGQGGYSKSVGSAPPRAAETAITNDFGAAQGAGTPGTAGSQAFGPPAVGLPEVPPLAWLSLAFVAVGIALFVLRFVARRIA